MVLMVPATAAAFEIPSGVSRRIAGANRVRLHAGRDDGGHLDAGVGLRRDRHVAHVRGRAHHCGFG
jgi:hypothetical protein